MVKNILIFVPNTFQTGKTGCVEGLYREYDDCEAYYITNSASTRESSQQIGYVSSGTFKAKNKDFKGVHFDRCSLKWEVVGQLGANTTILYDFEAFRKCDCTNSIESYGRHFRFLVDNLKKKRMTGNNGGRELWVGVAAMFVAYLGRFLSVANRTKVIWRYSATLTHFCDNLRSWRWVLDEVLKTRQLTTKIENLLISKLVDLVLGLFLLRLLLENEEFILELIANTRESIIHKLRDLLTYLMGSPIGLKLNYAFNHSLGKFFFYNISLWRIFLLTMQPLIREYFKLMVLPTVFGFSYQIAMISDIVSIATFHVYCIYVYAARLLHFQLKGLWSLWRLFIGRKYNPLRNRVDSIQYSQHQLFIGTLGFTVLLFLLPTSVMYYSLFVIFRLVIMVLEEILVKFRYLIQSLPVYAVTLWLLQSPKLAGSVNLKVRKSKSGIASFEAQLEMLPLRSVIGDCVPEEAKWSGGLSWAKIFTGVLL